MLANLSDNPYISLEAEWWSRLIYENLNLDGRMFFTMGDISPTMYQTASCMYLSTALAEDYGVSVDEICALVRNGKWTLDAVGGYTKDLSRDMNDDGVMSVDNDFFGLINSNTSLDVIACCATWKTIIFFSRLRRAARRRAIITRMSTRGQTRRVSTKGIQVYRRSQTK